MNIENIIKPENTLERLIISSPEFIEGILWGSPRSGHPEGQVIKHIAEVLANVDKYATEANRAYLRLITLIHDSFKFRVDKKKSSDGENHHAMIARRFAEQIGITDETILDIIQLHDEAYNSWCKGDRDGKWGKAEERAFKLIKRLEGLGDGAMDLYLAFYKCDNQTGDKSQDNYDWFESLGENKTI